MGLAGQARSERGYAMAALLLSMSIVALMMTVVMPVWKQTVQREKEAELVFRGLQYVHAITLYGRKFANTQPPSVDVLVQQKFLRKKFKDPITNDDFQLVLATASAPPASQQPGNRGGGASGASATPGGSTAPAQQTGRGGTSAIGTPGAGPVGGIIGVASKSKAKSIRLYNGRNHYNEWAFMYQPQQTPGAGGTAIPGPGGTPRGGTGTPNPFGGVGGGPGRGDRRGGPGGGPRPPGGPGSQGPGFPNGPPRPGGGRF